jgi:hypothetical protein
LEIVRVRRVAFLEHARRTAEKVIGLRRPDNDVLSHLVRAQTKQVLLQGRGETPNNPKCSLVVYRSPVRLRHAFDPASDDLLVVGAYPQNSGAYDQPKPTSPTETRSRTSPGLRGQKPSGLRS